MTAFNAHTSCDFLFESLEFVAFDIETTGISSRNDRIVEIGAVRFRLDGTEIDRFERLVHPGRTIPGGVIRIHGITDEMVRHAPSEREILPQFLEFLGDPRHTILMAHNASFDVGFLETALRRAAFAQPPHHVLDTVTFARRRARGLASYKLSSLVRTFGIGDSTAHRGLSDALALMELFRLLVEQPPRVESLTELTAYLSPELRFQNESRRRGGGWSGRRSRGRSFASPANPDPRESPWFETLNAALRDRARVSLVYEGGRSSGTPRTVTPVRITTSASLIYLVAYCDRDRIEKHFRFDRIREVRLGEGERGGGIHDST